MVSDRNAIGIRRSLSLWNMIVIRTKSDLITLHPFLNPEMVRSAAPSPEFNVQHGSATSRIHIHEIPWNIRFWELGSCVNPEIALSGSPSANGQTLREEKGAIRFFWGTKNPPQRERWHPKDFDSAPRERARGMSNASLPPPSSIFIPRPSSFRNRKIRIFLLLPR